MTYKEKLLWLNRYREADKKYRRLSDRLAEAQTATRRITQNVSAVPGSSGDGQSLARAVEREEEAERKAYAQLAVCDRLAEEIENGLMKLQSTNGYIVLHKYYLNCLTWEQIAMDMNLSVRWVFSLRRKAIEQLEI